MPQYNQKKAKTAGKIIIISLSLAILLFVLLPFLDTSSASSSKNSKKATPQIFTSNPLADLVKKIYALVTGNKAPEAKNENQEMLYAQNPEAVRHAANKSVNTDENSPAPANTTVNVSYDNYDDAGIVDDRGEWVLVRQTTPDMAQRGMHEINSNDNAYDKLVQLERSAKYSGVSVIQKEAYPDSKWARLWQPIKKLWTGDKAESQTAEDTPAMLASASRTKTSEKAQNKKATQYKRPGLSSWKNGALPVSGGQNGSSQPGLFGMLNPEFSVYSMAESLKAIAEKDLEGKEKDEFIQKIEKNKQQALLNMRAEILEQLRQEAAGQEPTDLLQENGPKGCDSRGLFYSKPKESEKCAGSEEEYAEESNQTAQEAYEASLAALSQAAGGFPLNPNDLNMMVILGPATKVSQAYVQRFDSNVQTYEEYLESSEQRQDQHLKEFYDYMLKEQGCANGTCFWVGGANQPNPDMKNIIVSSGMNYEGDPLNLMPDFVAGYREQKLHEIEQATDQSKKEELKKRAEEIEKDLRDYPPYYLPYTAEDIGTLSQRNAFDTNNPKKPEKPLLVHTPTASNALLLVEQGQWNNPALIVHEETVLDKAQPPAKETPETTQDDGFESMGPANAEEVSDRGTMLRNATVKQALSMLKIAKKYDNRLAQEGLSTLVKSNKTLSEQELQKEVSQNLGSK